MSLLRDLIPLMTALVWPLSILILVLYFRGGIKNLIASVVEARIGDSAFFKFGQAGADAVDKPTTTPKQLSAPAPPAVKWENTASLFWLGNDLEWTAQTVLRGAPKEKIIHGLTQCCHHLSELGLMDSDSGKQLSSLKSQVESLPEPALDRQWRDTFAEKIHSVIAALSILARGHQPNFRPFPQ